MILHACLNVEINNLNVNLFQDSDCMPVPVLQPKQMWKTQSIWSVDVCQTMVIYEQWLHASSDSRDQEPTVLRVSPSSIFKGVFILYFIFIN